MENLIIFTIKDFIKWRFDDLEETSDELKILNNYKTGTLCSLPIKIKPTKRIVVSWVGISSQVDTLDVRISLFVNGKWSKFFCYATSGFGLGLQNKTDNQDDIFVKMDTDELIAKDDYKIEQIKINVIFHHNCDNNISSPTLKMIGVCLESIPINNKESNLNYRTLPVMVDYNVPKYYQLDVDKIGSIICSPTSSLMLSEYYGIRFEGSDVEKMSKFASLVYDYGHEIYGNWAYNCAVMGALGLKACVGYLSSMDDLILYLINIGPLAISVKGNMVSENKTYHTNGHLLVIRGFVKREEKLLFIANDPFVPGVKCTYSYEMLDQNWRRICYFVKA